MDFDGRVGPIGGIAQKLAAAHDDGVTLFLAPKDNCDEVLGATLPVLRWRPLSHSVRPVRCSKEIYRLPVSGRLGRACATPPITDRMAVQCHAPLLDLQGVPHRPLEPRHERGRDGHLFLGVVGAVPDCRADLLVAQGRDGHTYVMIGFQNALHAHGGPAHVLRPADPGQITDQVLAVAVPGLLHHRDTFLFNDQREQAGRLRPSVACDVPVEVADHGFEVRGQVHVTIVS